MTFYNYCRWQSSTAGTGAFTVGSAVAADDISAHDVPENCDVVDGGVYRYFAQNGAQSEWGHGTYHVSSHTLSRTIVIVNSDGTTSAVNFAAAPIVDLFPLPQKLVSTSAFPFGTLMLFQQSSAPPGWVKQTTHNDKALRVVSGAAGSGGTNSFSSTFTSRTSDTVTLSISQIPSHQHDESTAATDGSPGDFPGWTSGFDGFLKRIGATTGANGGSGPHAHTYDMRVQYVDLIIAVKS